MTKDYSVLKFEWSRAEPPTDRDLLGLIEGAGGTLLAVVRWDGEQWSIMVPTDDEEWDGQKWDCKGWIHFSSLPIWVGEADDRDKVVAWADLPGLPPWARSSS